MGGSEDQARASLRQTLSELRGAIGIPAQQSIIATKEIITLVPGSAWIDAQVLEALAGSEDEDALKQAAELVRGDLITQSSAVKIDGSDNFSSLLTLMCCQFQTFQ